MAGASLWFNRVIACLYKTEYVNTHGYTDPSCTCAWNKSTRKEIEPKGISDIVVRKRINSKYQNTNDQDAEAREQISLRALQAFDPRQEPHRTKANEQVSSVMNFLLQFYLEAVLFKSIEGLGISTKKPRKHYWYCKWNNTQKESKRWKDDWILTKTCN